MIFFSRPLPTVEQPQEVILLVPSPMGGYMVHNFDWDHHRRAWDQAEPYPMVNLESARSCVPDHAEPWPVPGDIGAVECWVMR